METCLHVDQIVEFAGYFVCYYVHSIGGSASDNPLRYVWESICNVSYCIICGDSLLLEWDLAQFRIQHFGSY